MSGEIERTGQDVEELGGQISQLTQRNDGKHIHEAMRAAFKILSPKTDLDCPASFKTLARVGGDFCILRPLQLHLFEARSSGSGENRIDLAHMTSHYRPRRAFSLSTPLNIAVTCCAGSSTLYRTL